MDLLICLFVLGFLIYCNIKTISDMLKQRNNPKYLKDENSPTSQDEAEFDPTDLSHPHLKYYLEQYRQAKYERGEIDKLIKKYRREGKSLQEAKLCAVKQFGNYVWSPYGYRRPGQCTGISKRGLLEKITYLNRKMDHCKKALVGIWGINPDTSTITFPE